MVISAQIFQRQTCAVSSPLLNAITLMASFSPSLLFSRGVNHAVILHHCRPSVKILRSYRITLIGMPPLRTLSVRRFPLRVVAISVQVAPVPALGLRSGGAQPVPPAPGTGTFENSDCGHLVD
eukprot:905139-Rhodomonas_salina.5